MRLIDADAIVKRLKEWFCKNCNNYNWVKCRACEMDDALSAIDDAPTVDAVPVKHGRWKLVKAGGENYPFWDSVCSICNWKTTRVGGCDHYRFWPNCGAVMDGERRSE